MTQSKKNKKPKNSPIKIKNKLIKILMTVVVIIGLVVIGTAQPDPPDPDDNDDGNQTGGSAHLGAGTSILFLLASAYGIRRTYIYLTDKQKK